MLHNPKSLCRYNPTSLAKSINEGSFSIIITVEISDYIIVNCVNCALLLFYCSIISGVYSGGGGGN